MEQTNKEKRKKKHPNNNNIYTNKHESLSIKPYRPLALRGHVTSFL